MMAGGVTPSGSSRALRLDPFALPVRYLASDPAADERLRLVELHREGVVVRRAVRGMRMQVRAPIASFVGVAIRSIANTEFDGALAVMLEHRDPSLSVPLYVAADGAEVGAEWRLWGRVLGLPLLLADAEGVLRPAFARLGPVAIARAAPRRRRHLPIMGRRSSMALRRKPGTLRAGLIVHRGEPEMIART